MRIRADVLLSLVLLLAPALFAEQSFVVRKIDIQGNSLTRRWVIERELEFAPGDSLTFSELEASRKRLNNLSLFNSVRMNVNRDSGNVEVLLAEAWPLWPILNFSLSEGQLSDIVTKPRIFFRHAIVEAGATHFNIYGSGGKAYAAAQFGAEQGFDFGYETRWLAPRLPLAVLVHMANLHMSSRHASVRDSTVYERDIIYEVDISRRQGAPTRPGIRLAYVAMTPEHDHQLLPRHTARTVWFTPYLILDHRDLEWYPTRGSYAETRVDFVAGTPHFIRSFYDLRGYFPFSDADRPISLAMRFSAATSTDATPDWAHFYWGFSSALRGYSRVKSESSTYLIGDIELRVPLWHETTYNVPYLGRWGKRWPWGVSALAYAQRGELIIAGHRDERRGFGAGLYFRVPWVQIVQTSIALRKDGSKEFISGVGVSF
jgi:outer membrane protein assembly factor BamA